MDLHTLKGRRPHRFASSYGKWKCASNACVFRGEMASNGASKPFPEEAGQLIYDFCYDQEAAEWVPWMSTVAPYRWDNLEEKSTNIFETLTLISYRCGS